MRTLPSPQFRYMDATEQVILVDYSEWSPQWTYNGRYNYDMVVLKSNLQKTIRRQCVEEAVATAAQLLAQDAAECLRCLAAIITEDTLIQPALYAQIVWLLYAVTKSYILTVGDIQIIMDTVVTALESMKRYDLSEGIAKLQPIDIWAKDEETRLVYLSLKLVGRPNVLIQKALAEQLEYEQEISTVDLESIPVFNPVVHIIPSAIDPTSSVIAEIAQSCRLNQNAAKACIMWHWSAINERVATSESFWLEEAANCFTYSGFAPTMKRILTAAAQQQIAEFARKKTRRPAV